MAIVANATPCPYAWNIEQKVQRDGQYQEVLTVAIKQGTAGGTRVAEKVTYKVLTDGSASTVEPDGNSRQYPSVRRLLCQQILDVRASIELEESSWK